MIRITQANIGEETYIVTYREGEEAQAIRVVRGWAEDPDLDFNWLHAAKFARAISEAFCGWW